MNPDLINRRQLLVMAVLTEGGLAVLAVALGWWLGLNPWERLQVDMPAVLWGVLITLPMLAVFFVCARLPVGPFMDYGFEGKVWLLTDVTVCSASVPFFQITRVPTFTLTVPPTNVYWLLTSLMFSVLVSAGLEPAWPFARLPACATAVPIAVRRMTLPSSEA